ncbi:bifunctional methionine sulfoxide reductase B/A protein [Thiospirochaeta perfilievii]|uniref:Peptide methionine sulfoxide reductase MsrA n=1 Tax=Thiospirochaeta perfilievii TaxID=252967 RepID=A0A5C1Q754_9SPIO|nr:bifunctional methionine sulfoxide reductase B/A protein [Thiospirochaeta perfilievii]QEN03845.1 bifunctional methionine sulfoxide reductase B/A protein [Thiospirochaeta perfilievii]
MSNKLTKEEENIIIYKGTEAPFSGEYDDFFIEGFYHCKQCDTRLYSSDDKFNAGCGWPSFDDELPGTIDKKIDADGRRTEILCSNCGGHLGHLFKGENLTEKNSRYCVNSLSIKFKPSSSAYFAGGCFWGVEHLFQKQDGVYLVTSGYMGGVTNNPSYQDVCTGKTGHLEVVKVSYDPKIISYRELVQFFFEIHDSTQKNGQGPDIGPQYLSAIFYSNKEEFETAVKVINLLKSKGYDVATELFEASKFWKAEEYHQDYYQKNNKEPYCHTYKKIF